MSVFVRAFMLLLSTVVWSTGVTAAAIELGTGVWLDDDHGAVIAGVPGWPLSVYRVEDGDPLWRYKTDAQPVMVTDEYVLAFESASRSGWLTLVSLRKRDGKRIAREVARLPRGVLASTGTDLASRFQLRPHPKFKTSRLVWAFTPAMATEEGVRALPQSGVLSVDAATARAGALDESAPPRDTRSARLSVPFADSNAPAFYSADRQHVIVSERQEDAPGFEWALYDRDTRLLARLPAKVAFVPFVVRGDLLVTLHASAQGWRAKKASAPVLRVLDWRRGEIKWQRTLSAEKTK